MEKTGKQPTLDMIENYRSGDMEKFNLLADTFFRAGFGSVQYRGAQSNMLLSEIMTEFDEAFIVAILHNGFDRWVQEAAIINNEGTVDSKRLVKTKWTDTGSAAKKYEGWVEKGVQFYNDQVRDLQIIRQSSGSKTMEEKYRQQKKESMEEKKKGPVKRAFLVSALNGLVAVEEVVVDGSELSVRPTTVTYEANKRGWRQLGNDQRRRILTGSEQASSLSASDHEHPSMQECTSNSDDDESEATSSYHTMPI
jgi:hypothetical protein